MNAVQGGIMLSGKAIIFESKLLIEYSIEKVCST